MCVSALSARVPEQPMVSKTITEKEKVYMNDKFFHFLDEIYNLKDASGNEFSYAFHALPLRANIEYYKVIKVPMSYSKIKMASKHKRYTHPQAFINDLVQISWNARFFNEETSDYYKFAMILDSFIRETVIPTLVGDKNIYKHDEIFYPNLGPLPNEPQSNAGNASNAKEAAKNASATGASSATAAAASTNAASTPAAEDEEDEEYKEEEVKQEERRYTHEPETDYRAITNQSYNPNTYVATIEDTGKSHIYTPPKPITNPSPNRQVLEQWVKRGRPPIVDKPHEQRIKSIMRGLKKIKVGNKTIVSFWDKLPSQQEHPDYLRIVKDPISMLDIKSLIKQRYYKTVDAYVSDVFKLINNNRNYFVHDEFIKNNLNILETNISRLYQIEMSKPDVEYMSGQQTSRFPLSQVVFNNRTYKVGNWVLIANPNDSMRPTVGQIFRLWQQEDGEMCMNVCWYYRPEWTVHRVDRLFLDNEVVKTGQYRDHLVSEILGPCYVAYFTRWLKGDPGIPFEGPLFVCEFRYNDRENTFAKIRTWKACLPDEVRHLEDPIKPLTSNRVLKKYPSPIKNLLAPGSTPNSPIPQPIILNLNSPPLVGAVYVPRPNDEVDLHYFDGTLSESQCKSYVPPTTNIRIPSSALIDNYNSGDGHESTPETQLGGDFNGNGMGIMGHGHNYNGNHNSLNNGINSNNPVNKLMGNPSFMTIPANPMAGSLKRTNNSMSSMTSFKAYTKPTMNLNVSHVYPGSHKIIKSPYNLGTYSFSQYHSPSPSFTYVRYNGQEENLQEMVKASYAGVDRHNFERINNIVKQQQHNMGSFNDALAGGSPLAGNPGKSGNVDKHALLWFRGPPLKIVDRILGDEVYDSRKGSIGVKRIRCGHSAEYIAWKMKKQKQ